MKTQNEQIVLGSNPRDKDIKQEATLDDIEYMDDGGYEEWLFRYEDERHRPDPRECQKSAEKDGVTLESMCADCDVCRIYRDMDQERYELAKE